MKKVFLSLMGVAAVSLAMGLTSCGSKSDKSESEESENTEAVSEESSSDDEESSDILGSSSSSDDESVSSSDDADDESVSSSSSSSSDIDAALDSYEEYVDSYVSLVKKAKEGDASALAEYASMMSKAQDAFDKLDKAKSEMTAAQSGRLLKIHAKMAKAAM